MSTLTARVALVTGGASGIGRAAALAFAREGAAVVIADIDDAGGQESADSIRSAGGRAIYVPCDVADRFQVEALVAVTVEHFGRLDYAFNNAGHEGPMAPTAEYLEQDWERILAVNLTGVWHCMKYEMRQMLRQRRGAIVNAASVASLVAERGFPAYAAAKGGVLQLTRTAAVEYAGSGVRINAICPGAIRTPMMDRALATVRPSRMMPGMTRSPWKRWLFDALFSLGSVRGAMMRFAQPMGRLGEPEEVAEAVVWLCSDAASFMTGQHITIDGGMVAA